MRGSVYYQTGVLAKLLFAEGMSKVDQKKSGNLANANTLKAYREVWNELGNFLKHEHKLSDFQQIESRHIEVYFRQKIVNGISEQRAELISSALGKLEIALKSASEKFDARYIYDFSVRQNILDDAKELGLLKKGSKSKDFSRAYSNPIAVIGAIASPPYKLAAKIQLEGGCRVEAVIRIDKEMRLKTRKLENNSLEEKVQVVGVEDEYSILPQLQGVRQDEWTNQQKGYLLTVEKGGKPGLIALNLATYKELEDILRKEGVLKIDYYSYLKSLKVASQKTAQKYQGTHGLRWNFAQNRLAELQKYGLSYREARQIVSWEMKHFREDITGHYTA